MALIDTLRTIGSSEKRLLRRELKALSGLTSADHAAFWSVWPAIPPARRREIVRAIVELAEDNVEFDIGQLCLWCIDDDDPLVRASAVEGLWEDQRTHTLQRMLALLRNDPSPQVREAAALGLSRFAYMASLGELEAYAALLHDTLLAAIEDPDQPLEVRRRAIESAGYFAGSAAMQDQVARAFDASEQPLRESALVAMGRSMLPRWLPSIERELADPEPALRYEAARAAGELADTAEPLLPRLIPLVADTDTEVAMAAIWALGQIGGERAQQALQRVRDSGNAARSNAAAEALQELSLDDLFG